MVRIINVCSGKGGVGKTTVALNLAAALQKIGKNVVVIDCNFTTPHIGLYLGMYSLPMSINNFLRNEAKLQDAVYTHSSGIRFIPASLNAKDLINTNTDNLKSEIMNAFSSYDFVLLDSAPGIGKEAVIAMNASDETLFVAEPYIPSVVDVGKYSQIPDFIKLKPNGIVLNKIRNKKYELSENDIRQFTNIPVIGCVPQDNNILKCVNSRMLVTSFNKKSPSSREFFKLASKISGIEYKQSKADTFLSLFGLRRASNV
jgi:cell division ATPase MinD